MTQPELFDVVELLVDLPEFNLRAGIQGAIVECYRNNNYEVEFSNSDGETLALCSLSTQQFVVVWSAKTKTWLSVPERVAAIVKNLDDNRQKEVLDFARFLHHK
ncbi:DUF4926 domain-containing protein [Pleurocapsales cyanobacterium LEGE 10410]|nr:DUF4926 domain-containing protein [Pleurocapsales cyanobacterium LEGE 10410]